MQAACIDLTSTGELRPLLIHEAQKFRLANSALPDQRVVAHDGRRIAIDDRAERQFRLGRVADLPDDQHGHGAAERRCDFGRHGHTPARECEEHRRGEIERLQGRCEPLARVTSVVEHVFLLADLNPTRRRRDP